MGKLYTITFSPTGTSMKAAAQIAEAFDLEKKPIDLCEGLAEKIQMAHEDIGIFSAPCYGGRIPQPAVERLSYIHGEKTPAIVCVTFGNRAFEDALLELADCVEANGFQVIAGCAVVGEHNIMHCFGCGRPDSSDLEEIHRFAVRAAQKARSSKTGRPIFPGNRPYKERHPSTMPILVDQKSCVSCGTCTAKCPMKAISSDGLHTDETLCINCMRCIQICPQKSRSLPEQLVSDLTQRLRNACKDRKANEFYE